MIKTVNLDSGSIVLKESELNSKMINFKDFQKMDLKVVKIMKVEKVRDSEKLLRLELDVGSGELRQIVAGIAQFYEPEGLVGKEIVIVANLEPRMVFGLKSQGMLLAATNEEQLAILVPDKEVQPGTKVQ